MWILIGHYFGVLEICFTWEREKSFGRISSENLQYLLCVQIRSQFCSQNVNIKKKTQKMQSPKMPAHAWIQHIMLVNLKLNIIIYQIKYFFSFVVAWAFVSGKCHDYLNSLARLPDFCWYTIPKWVMCNKDHKIHQIVIKYYKGPHNLPKMVIKYFKVFNSVPSKIYQSYGIAF
jgi:hypothetical protein